jgi:hypothetical protein
MGIRFTCPHCQGKLHVKSFLAGKRGICPHCQGAIEIPEASASAVGGVAESRREAAAAGHGPRQGAKEMGAERREGAEPVNLGGVEGELHWYVRPPEGGEYGPADARLMEVWVQEGRIAAEALVWRTGWPEWQAWREVAGQFAARPGSERPRPDPGAGALSEPEATPVVPAEATSGPMPVPAPARPAAEVTPHVPVSGPAVPPIVVTERTSGTSARRAEARYRRRRGDRKSWWVATVVLLGLAAVALLITLVVVLMNQTT